MVPKLKLNDLALSVDALDNDNVKVIGPIGEIQLALNPVDDLNLLHHL